MDDQLKVAPALAPTQEMGGFYDVVIVGAGPAGLSAAACAGRDGLRTLVIDGRMPGGQVSISYLVDNYLGFPRGCLGPDLAQKMEAHARDYETVQFLSEHVEDVSQMDDGQHCVQLSMGTVYVARAVVLAIGLEPKPLGLVAEKGFLGRGVSYYTQCDGSSYADRSVVVVGGGNCACYAAKHLADRASALYLVHDSDQLSAVGGLRATVLAHPNVQPIWNAKVVDIFGVDRVEKIQVQHLQTGQTTWLDTSVMFVYVGRIPPTSIVSIEIDRDSHGYIVTDEFMQTTVPGLYAVGDIRDKPVRQIATAVADGLMAAVHISQLVL